jgi:hypothetical protein
MKRRCRARGPSTSHTDWITAAVEGVVDAVAEFLRPWGRR